MLLMFAWYVKLLTEILGWGSFLVIGLAGVILLLGGQRKVLGWCCGGYAVGFLILRLFFAQLYFRWMPGVTIFLMILSSVWSDYGDRVNGKRWWNA